MSGARTSRPKEQIRFIATIVLLGPPGAGKGTQAKRIAERYHIPRISLGDLLRHIAAGNADPGRQIKEFIARGELVPDHVVFEVIAQRLRHTDCSRGFVMDGFPRTRTQACWLDSFLERDFPASSRGRHAVPIVILIQVDPDHLLLRLAGRRVCPSCGRTYNIYLQPPRAREVCDLDGSKLTRRDDDREEVVRARLVSYELETRPVAEYYRRKGQLFTVDGNLPVDQVTGQIVGVIEKRVKFIEDFDVAR